MFDDLTKKENEIFQFIKDTINNKGYPPTVREICTGVGLKSPSSVHGYLTRLEDKGYIERASMKTRAISIAEPYDDTFLGKKDTVDIPIIGDVTAGQPILAYEETSDTFPIPASMAKDKELFMLKVHGDSMINAGIFDGDYVLIERRSNAKNGDIVLALIEDSATIKSLYIEDNIYRLQPENDTMDPIYVEDLDILGHVIGLYRNLI